MDWEDLRHFAAFAAHGSLSAAARHLHVEHATVARRLAALEGHLKITLIDRRGRRLVLTPDGVRIAAIAERMVGDTEAIARLAQGARTDLVGDVVISAPPAYAAQLAAPLVELGLQHPGLRVHLLGEAHTASLDKREADLAIRLSRPDGGDLTAVRIGRIDFHLYASRAYLARTAQDDWRFIGNAGLLARSPQQAAVDNIAANRAFALTSDHVEIQLALARAGGGVAMLPDFLAADEPSLVRARPLDPPFQREVWLAVHSDVKQSAPIRAVIDCLKRWSIVRESGNRVRENTMRHR